MQLTTAQIWERIHTAGIATPEQCRQWAKSVSEAIGTAGIADPAAVIKELVQQDKLSPYQANVLYRGLSHPLQLGKLRVTRSLETERGANWYEGEDSASARWSAFPPKAVWMVALPDEKLAQTDIQAWPPSLQWAQQHIQVQSPHLDRWVSAGATLKHLYAVCESVPGLLLSEMLQQGPLSSTQAYRMLRDVAMGMKFLHHHRLVHGHLSTRSVVWNEIRGFQLLRDPFFPPRSPFHSPTLSVIGGLDERLALAAPELILPDALPTIESDLYALGCLWFRCLTGNWPVDPGPQAAPEVWAKLHAQVPVVAPAKIPEVQKRCLSHLLAKDPTVRFPGVDQLLRALDQLVLNQPVMDQPPEAIPSDPAPTQKPTQQQENVAAPKLPPSQKATPTPKAQASSANTPKPQPTPQPTAPTKTETSKPQAKKLQPGATPSKPVESKPAKPVESKPAPQKPVESKPQAIEPTKQNTPVEAKEPTPQPTAPTPVRIESPLPVKTTPSNSVTPVESPATATSVSKTPQTANPTKQTAPAPLKTKKKKAASKPFGPKKKNQKPAWFMPLVVACSLLLLSVLLLVLRGNNKAVVTIEPKPAVQPPPTPLTTTPSTTASNNRSGSGIDPMLEYFNVKAEDTGVPWTPPSIGSPYSTEMLPAGLEALLLLSPEAWSQSKTTSKELVDWWKSVYAQAPDTSELPAITTDSLASLSLAWYPGETTGTYRKVYRLVWKEPKTLESLITDINTWKPQEIQSDNKKYRYWTKEQQGQSIALITDDFSTKSDQQVKRVSIGPLDLLKTLLDSQGKSGPLRRQLDALLQTTDSRADMTFLAAPSFVFVDGKQMFGEHSEKVLGVMREVIDDRVQAILVRTHLEPQLYVEYRMLGNDLQSAPRDAVLVKQKLETLADSVESQFAAQPAAAYWRAIANRFPQMLRTVHKYARSGAEDGQVVFNVYLPKEATTNLAIGSWMALQGGASAGPAKVASTPKAPPNSMKSIEEMLDAKISLRVEQESLEVVLQAIANELKDSHTGGVESLPMAINGTAFQKDGITRNQQVRNFEFKDTPVREILTALCRRANPVTTVQKPTEKDQKVVWLLLDDPNTPSKKKLDMTTRAWAESNQAALPKEFVE